MAATALPSFPAAPRPYGGVAIGDTVFAGSQVASSGGTASNTMVSGDTVVLESGAVVSGRLDGPPMKTRTLPEAAVPWGLLPIRAVRRRSADTQPSETH